MIHTLATGVAWHGIGRQWRLRVIGSTESFSVLSCSIERMVIERETSHVTALFMSRQCCQIRLDEPLSFLFRRHADSLARQDRVSEGLAEQAPGKTTVMPF